MMITEKDLWSMNGYLGIIIMIILIGCAILSIWQEQLFIGIIFFVIAIILVTGFTVVLPNEAIVVLFFGKYIGSFRQEGLLLTVPFSRRKKISLRIRHFNSKRLKVNDLEGNPFEISAVVVYKVVDAAKALFDVNEYEQFVDIQIETALQSVATKFTNDVAHEEDLALRGNSEEIMKELKSEVNKRLYIAGVEMIEVQLTYFPDTTEKNVQMILERQYASVIVATRKQIVEDAVQIAKDTIMQLEQDGMVLLNDDKRMRFMNNLIVSIIADDAIQPIIQIKKTIE